ncbi:matrix-remodeling-associated protein 5-like [Dipodomys spectabilis]|uniref:matrix-remodeling-associated protein 5-like n=1 Tax=Dipodomys spectabilis TaxID=105255 RepID=UPI001C53ECC4|nr:matrix-remodeling-associated protein 5-like [Dipodomys spectabilis]
MLDPKMERVNLGFNHIRVLTHASFPGLARLQLLLLHGNEIADIAEGALSDLGALQKSPLPASTTSAYPLPFSTERSPLPTSTPPVSPQTSPLPVSSQTTPLPVTTRRSPLLTSTLPVSPWTSPLPVSTRTSPLPASTPRASTAPTSALPSSSLPASLLPAPRRPGGGRRQGRQHKAHRARPGPTVNPRDPVVTTLHGRAPDVLPSHPAASPDGDPGTFDPRPPAPPAVTPPRGVWNELDTGVELTPAAPDTRGTDTSGSDSGTMDTLGNVTRGSETHTMVTRVNITRERDTITSLPHSPDTHEARMRGSDTRGNVMHASPAPPVLREAPTEFVSAHAGLTLHLPCTAQAWPPVALHWRLPDGTHARPVHAHTHPRLSDVYVLPNGTLVLRRLQAPRHAGEYECVAANALSSARRTVHVEVTPAPARLPPSVRPRGPLATRVPHGADLTLHCHARGDPAPRVFWRLPDGHLVDAGSSSDIRVRAFSNGTLSVRPVTSRDAGEYVCVARNAAGDAHARLRVELMAGPGASYLQPGLPVTPVTPVTQDADPREDCTAYHRLQVPSGVLEDPDVRVARPDGSVGNWDLGPGLDLGCVTTAGGAGPGAGSSSSSQSLPSPSPTAPQ